MPIFGIDNMLTLLLLLIVFAGLASIAIVVIFEVKKTPKQESELIEREDEAMSKLPDHPHEMAKWVP